MNKLQYAQLLTDPRWNEVRLRILKRDNLRCVKCGKKDCRLSVHHKIYVSGKLPWEYPDRFLMSLCDECHKRIHTENSLKSFFRDSIPPPKKKKKRKKGQVKYVRGRHGSIIIASPR